MGTNIVAELLVVDNASHARCGQLLRDLRSVHGKLRVLIEPYSAVRSLTANAAYWAGTVTPAAAQLGYESADELHRWICCQLYGYTEDTKGGMIRYTPQRTTTSPRKMTKQEFQEHTTRAQALLAEAGVQLPSVDRWTA